MTKSRGAVILGGRPVLAGPVKVFNNLYVGTKNVCPDLRTSLANWHAVVHA